MSQPIISIQNLSKQYRLGNVGTGTLSHDLNKIWHKIRGKEDPTLKIGEINDRTQKGGEFVWALKDVSFDVNQGDAVGIIGRNGAGKSTLLKILSKITKPSTGHIKLGGRIASLLEVGTGFHPELTGRENVYLNGTIYGMKIPEIKKKFDEIVAFSGVEKYIDTPVKRYSSGMYVRLAFAVAAHLEPEILIIDEVLAVGDAEFQKKCLGKMNDVSKKEGRTVLFVSHNMTAINNLCSSAVLLENGTVTMSGNTNKTIDCYLNSNVTTGLNILNIYSFKNDILIKSLNLDSDNFFIDNEVNIEINIECLSDSENYYHVNLFFTDGGDNTIFVICSEPNIFKKGNYSILFLLPANFLNDRLYSINLMLVENSTISDVTIDYAYSIEPKENKRKIAWQGKYPGFIRPSFIKSKIIKNE